jgi:hypothetical protein
MARRKGRRKGAHTRQQKKFQKVARRAHGVCILDAGQAGSVDGARARFKSCMRREMRAGLS